MTGKPILWMRHESRPHERRAPIAPVDVADLVAAGFRVVVEESPMRVFPLHEYEEAGALVAPADSWPDAPEGAMVIGLKELSDDEVPLRDHLFFGEAFEGQKGADRLLRRFCEGGGTLYDLQRLVDDDGHRVASFNYWGGYLGAALAVLEARFELPRFLRPMNKQGLDDMLATGGDGAPLRALVIGALGRSGRGACDALDRAGVEVTRWDREETRTLDKAAVLDHDILVNAVKLRAPLQRPFLVASDLDAPDRRLSVISDVTLDVTSDCNALPLYHDVTTWDSPVLELRGGCRSVRLIAIENLPALLPREASISYSTELRPVLSSLPDGPVWQRARETFRRHAPSLVAC